MNYVNKLEKLVDEMVYIIAQIKEDNYFCVNAEAMWCHRCGKYSAFLMQGMEDGKVYWAVQCCTCKSQSPKCFETGESYAQATAKKIWKGGSYGKRNEA